MNENNKRKEFDKDDFLKEVEKAASKGTAKASIKNGIISTLPVICILLVLALLIIPKINKLNNGLNYMFKTDAPVSDHDLTLENYGWFGHTVADFEDAILGDTEKLKKLEVYKQEVSDVSMITDTGLFNIGLFTKNQLITYYADAIYTVDLSKLSKSDIQFDKQSRIITLYIPHANQEELNIPEDRIKFSDPDRGLLAFGDIKATPQQIMEVQAGARERMQKKLDEDNVIDIADRFAKLAVWEMYSPIIKGVAKDYSLEVKFK